MNQFNKRSVEHFRAKLISSAMWLRETRKHGILSKRGLKLASSLERYLKKCDRDLAGGKLKFDEMGRRSQKIDLAVFELWKDAFGHSGGII